MSFVFLKNFGCCYQGLTGYLNFQDHVPVVVASNTPKHLTANDRRALLSDSADPESPKKPQSVFDFISFEDRQRLEAAKRKPVELGFKGKSESAEVLQEEQKVGDFLLYA